jgi:hypothetical protein
MRPVVIKKGAMRCFRPKYTPGRYVPHMGRSDTPPDNRLPRCGCGAVTHARIGSRFLALLLLLLIMELGLELERASGWDDASIEASLMPLSGNEASTAGAYSQATPSTPKKRT